MNNIFILILGLVIIGVSFVLFYLSKDETAPEQKVPLVQKREPLKKTIEEIKAELAQQAAAMKTGHVPEVVPDGPKQDAPEVAVPDRPQEKGIREPAPFVPRILALMVDYFVCCLPVLIYIVIVFFPIILDVRTTELLDFIERNPARLLLIILVSQTAYQIFFIGKKGQTMGKQILSLKVCAGNDQAPGYIRAVIRGLFYNAYFIFPPALVLSGLPVFFTKQRVTLHDLLSGTKVVLLK